MKERILDILKDKERSIHELQHVLDLNNSEGFTVLLKALNQLEDEGKIDLFLLWRHQSAPVDKR